MIVYSSPLTEPIFSMFSPKAKRSRIQPLYMSLGFTLIELISVMVILGIIATIGTRFVVTTVDSYAATEKRAKLTARGRVVVEQITRQLRLAVPYSLRLSSSGNCLEFMPGVAGGAYLERVADETLPGSAATSSITTAPFSVGLGAPTYLIIGAMSNSDIYAPAGNALVDINSITYGATNTINFSAPHRFERNSINQRFFIGDSPKRFCFSGGQILEYGSYGLLSAAVDDSNPGGSSLVMAENVTTNSTFFSISPGSEDRNVAVSLDFTFTERGQVVTMNNTVLLHNVP